CASWTATQHVGGIQAYEQKRERRRLREKGAAAEPPVTASGP
ncbi:MAG: hypothetical protein QOF84_6590, partial [Streptomyces sp.]|nr:hypothetical protein [Streptomyces sp.]